MTKSKIKFYTAALDCLNNNKNISILREKFDQKILNQTGLLSIKPIIYVCNVDEQSLKNGNKFIETVY